MPVPKIVHYLRCLALHPDVAAVVFRHKVQKISRIELVTVGVIGWVHHYIFTDDGYTSSRRINDS